MASAIRQDLEFGWRLMRRSPGFSAIVILTLALGIGACATLLSIVYDGFFVHVAHEEDTYAIIASVPQRHIFQYRFSVPEFRDVLGGASGFQELGAITGFTAVLNRGEYPEQVPGAYISANIIPMLKTPPILGRAFRPDEDRPGGPRVALIDGEFWKRVFNSDPLIIGRDMELDQQKYTIVGVLPEHYGLWGASVYVPMQLDMAATNRTDRPFWITGTLQKGVSMRAAEAALQAVSQRWQHDYGSRLPEYNGMQMVVRNVPEWVHAAIRPSILILIAATGLVLLVATLNLANLLLARAAARRSEAAVRAALGATRGRIARQVLTESSLFAVAGSAIGMLIAAWAVPVAASLIPYDLLTPANGAFRLEPIAVAVSFAAALLMGISFGMAPAMRMARVDVAVALKEAGARMTGDRAGTRRRNFLVISETALAIVLLAGAGLLIQSYRTLMRTDLGFRPEDVLSMQVALSRGKYPATQDLTKFYRQLLPRLAAIPGADGAAATTGRPGVDRQVDLMRQDFIIEGRPAPDGRTIPNAAASVVSRDYFKLMGMRLIAGRVFRDSDAAGAPQVVVVNQALVKAYFADSDPVGQRIRLQGQSPALARPGDPSSGATFTIVGVIADAKQLRIIEAPVQPQIFVPLEQRPEQSRAMTLFVRGRIAPASLESAVRQAVAAVDRTQPVTDVMTMDEVVSDAFGPKRITTVLLGIFAALAMGLVVIGFYAVISYGVSQRTREIGVRMALGAPPSRISRMVLLEGARLAAWGIAAGILCALLLTRFLQSMLFGVSSADPVALAAASALLFGVTLAACWLPARRAMRVDPMTALRHE